MAKPTSKFCHKRLLLYLKVRLNFPACVSCFKRQFPCNKSRLASVGYIHSCRNKPKSPLNTTSKRGSLSTVLLQAKFHVFNSIYIITSIPQLQLIATPLILFINNYKSFKLHGNACLGESTKERITNNVQTGRCCLC